MIDEMEHRRWTFTRKMFYFDVPTTGRTNRTPSPLVRVKFFHKT